MAFIDDVVVTVPDTAPADVKVSEIKGAIARQFWGWAYAHQDDVLFRRKLLWIVLAVRVRDLFPLFETLFGDPGR